MQDHKPEKLQYFLPIGLLDEMDYVPTHSSPPQPIATTVSNNKETKSNLSQTSPPGLTKPENHLNGIALKLSDNSPLNVNLKKRSLKVVKLSEIQASTNVQLPPKQKYALIRIRTARKNNHCKFNKIPIGFTNIEIENQIRQNSNKNNKNNKELQYLYKRRILSNTPSNTEIEYKAIARQKDHYYYNYIYSMTISFTRYLRVENISPKIVCQIQKLLNDFEKLNENSYFRDYPGQEKIGEYIFKGEVIPFFSIMSNEKNDISGIEWSFNLHQLRQRFYNIEKKHAILARCDKLNCHRTHLAPSL